MRVLLDANVVLDAIAAREPFKDDAQRIFRLVAHNELEGFLSANCVTDIYYIARKYLPDSEVRDALRKLFYFFTVIDLRGADCEAALAQPMPDYEDAVVSICARKAGAEYIVTRDEVFLKTSDTPQAISPSDFLKIFGRPFSSSMPFSTLTSSHESP